MMYNSLPEFERNIERSIDAGNLDEALQTIEDLVSEVIQDSASIARVFGSARLDSLCQRIGLEIAKRHGATNAASGNNKSDRVVIVATELYNTGGHTAVIEQIIKAQPEKEFLFYLRIYSPDWISLFFKAALMEFVSSRPPEFLPFSKSRLAPRKTP